jgi:hypothetical protein
VKKETNTKKYCYDCEEQLEPIFIDDKRKAHTWFWNECLVCEHHFCEKHATGKSFDNEVHHNAYKYKDCESGNDIWDINICEFCENQIKKEGQME